MLAAHPEVLPHVIDPRVPWTADMLSDLLSATPDLSQLPNARHDEAEGKEPLVLLPNLGTTEDYVLRVNWRTASNDQIRVDAQSCTKEFRLLDAIARKQGIQRLIPPHSIFSGTNQGITHEVNDEGLIIVNTANVYTVVEKIGDGRTLADTLRVPQYTRTHIALGRMILDYLSYGQMDRNRLYDVSGLDQYSWHPQLYDLQLLDGPGADGVIDQLIELQEWLSELYRSHEKLQLLDKAKRLHEACEENPNTYKIRT